MKTIFITVARGFIMRNILRSGVLESLKKADVKIIIFVSVLTGRKRVPEYLEREFNDNKVKIVGIPEPAIPRGINKLHSIFSKYTAKLVFTESTWAHSKYYNRKRGKYWAYVERIIYLPLSKINFLKVIVRYFYKLFFNFKGCAEYFDKYKPNIIFSGSIISALDIAFMKEAAKRNIKTISMPKGWDNITKHLYFFVPDKLVVQNKLMKEGAIREQKIKADRIEVCGFPQFDWYRRKEILLSRKEYFSKIGLDPGRKLIFFGSEGHWTSKDDHIPETIADEIKNNKFAKPCSMFIRSHFSDVKKKRFNRFIEKDNVKVDDNFNLSDFFWDSVDPDREEIIQFVNTIYHCDVLVTLASTLVLDACCMNKPIVSVAYGGTFDPRDGKDITNCVFDHDHFRDVVATNGIDVVKSEKELIESINNYLLHPEYKNKERQVLLDKLCYKVDGRSSERIVNVILSVINK